MTYTEIVRELYERSGLQINEYAQRIRYSVTQLSLVLNGHKEATLKMAEVALADADLSLEDCLVLPDGKTVAAHYAPIVHRIIDLLDLGGTVAEGIKVIVYAQHEVWVKKKRRKRAV